MAAGRARALAGQAPEVAVAEAKAALEDFERLEAARHADAAGALLRSLGAPVRTGPKEVGALTRREVEVLQLVGAGLSNPEIAERLSITRRTVEHHVGNLLARLGLRNRAEAAAYASRRKLGPWIGDLPDTSRPRPRHPAPPSRRAPPELQQLLAAAAGNQEAMDAFARVMAGVTSPTEFFSEQNVGRILALADT